MHWKAEHLLARKLEAMACKAGKKTTATEDPDKLSSGLGLDFKEDQASIVVKPFKCCSNDLLMCMAKKKKLVHASPFHSDVNLGSNIPNFATDIDSEDRITNINTNKDVTISESEEVNEVTAVKCVTAPLTNINNSFIDISSITVELSFEALQHDTSEELSTEMHGFLTGIETADPNAPEIGEDDTNASWV
ncbi:hypothetical protein Clacol_004255 [Clathrus columnatus]|uniref:Uncharacterized protein n=1 Tax=Clathrus columnatus TaxID=1419009 RepID=A0AAV5ABD5_9AGAM|nr:hypothetical protein Clacol_004255 [Clathrus columnatus]